MRPLSHYALGSGFRLTPDVEPMARQEMAALPRAYAVGKAKAPLTTDDASAQRLMAKAIYLPGAEFTREEVESLSGRGAQTAEAQCTAAAKLTRNMLRLDLADAAGLARFLTLAQQKP
jgi:hypothetical protein